MTLQESNHHLHVVVKSLVQLSNLVLPLVKVKQSRASQDQQLHRIWEAHVNGIDLCVREKSSYRQELTLLMTH